MSTYKFWMRGKRLVRLIDSTTYDSQDEAHNCCEMTVYKKNAAGGEDYIASQNLIDVGSDFFGEYVLKHLGYEQAASWTVPARLGGTKED